MRDRRSSLQKSTESGDGLPTQGQLDVFALLKGELDEHLAALEAVIASDLPKVNAALTGSGLEAIADG
ncbi:hypothetical protein NOR51B_2503 [Luminiphilus syltensis NOR5-1B]|uniref:Uncharacterized protein n=1 Tax=Luminiphilus syltensis NOR5-1B TaxID=565045 RepID=B8KTD9_9GAMM|nr:hypothetical protein [Luminiphilus syltensis]EED36551.1 hypothetical protein NOR51B_2503 [Luminiphilus syltensis NOR5-1B]